MKISELTPREQTVARALALGQSNRAIAAGLEISVKTVDTHRMHILKKLGLAGNVALARQAIAEGEVPAPTLAPEAVYVYGDNDGHSDDVPPAENPCGALS